MNRGLTRQYTGIRPRLTRIRGLRWLAVTLVWVVTGAAQLAPAQDASSSLEKALTLGLPVVQTAAARYPEHRKCFSCHHQTLPILAISAILDSGIAVDPSIIKSHAEFTFQ